jgi:hypothetical protein
MSRQLTNPEDGTARRSRRASFLRWARLGDISVRREHAARDASGESARQGHGNTAGPPQPKRRQRRARVSNRLTAAGLGSAEQEPQRHRNHRQSAATTRLVCVERASNKPRSRSNPTQDARGQWTRRPHSRIFAAASTTRAAQRRAGRLPAPSPTSHQNFVDGLAGLVPGAVASHVQAHHLLQCEHQLGHFAPRQADMLIAG